jgi:hypothetical protein
MNIRVEEVGLDRLEDYAKVQSFFLYWLYL